jgi:hypothetical protein
MEGTELAHVEVITDAAADELFRSLYRDPKAIKDLTIGYARARERRIGALVDRAATDPEVEAALRADAVGLLTREGVLSPLDTVTVRHSFAEGTFFGVRTRCQISGGRAELSTERRWLTLRLRDSTGEEVQSEPFLALAVEISYTGSIEYVPVPRDTSNQVSVVLDAPQSTSQSHAS